MNKTMASRREFLEALGALGAASIVAESLGSPGVFAAEGKEKLAIEGGTPVRTSPLHSRPYGPQFYDGVEKQELIDVLDSRYPFRWWGGKSKVLEFEKSFAAHIGVKHAIAVTSGTTALYTAMAAMEIGPGDEVILPAWTWYADYDAVVLSGALPVFVDIDESFAIDPQQIEAKITPRTKVIVPSHLQGGLADMDAILEIARKHKIRVVEDCAQCAGGKYKGKFVGTIGDMGINSFQLSKTITAGEGGAVVSNDPQLFERAVRFHDVGSLRSPYTEEFKGGLLAGFAACNFRMNEFTGAVLKGQVQKLATICSRLRAKARQVREAIADLPGLKLRKTPDPEGDLGSTVFLLFETRARRNRFLQAMAAEGVPASPPGGSVILPADARIANKATIHPAWPSFQSPQGKAIRYGSASCRRTIDILGRAGGVIMDPNFSPEDVSDIAKAIRKVYLAMGRGPQA
jgi:8-amino-3,8-dideoxy-alpha-D-manno-octulosonate transaminase